MPPIVLDPPNNGVTRSSFYNFSNTNAHGIHPAISVTRWKVTVTTGLNNGGTLITQSAWFTTPITTCPVSNLPADNASYYGQIVYEKPTGGTWVSTSNKFQSCP
jgi:hypothetical protein